MNAERRLTWEEAVRWYRAQPDNERAIEANYFDLPVRRAAERFAAGEEFAEAQRCLHGAPGRTLLDLGAGNGIASFAFARAGWQVTALEPDPSSEVGAGAISQLASDTSLSIEILEGRDALPTLDAGRFAAIHARQVLHHLPNLPASFGDLSRVLAPGGLMLATREHVVHNAAELTRFLAAHPLHHLYSGENAHPLNGYLGAARAAGFEVLHVWGPLQSILNFFPGTEAERQRECLRVAHQRWLGLGRFFSHSPAFIEAAAAEATRRDRWPGRIYSFLFRKPSASLSA